jgi:RNA polymerase sigma-70 factor, ECF subfamily
MDKMIEEQALLLKSHAFEQTALANIYDEFSPKLYRYAWRMLGEESLAEECVAETFSRWLQALANGGGPKEHLQAYLYRTAHNWITDRYRRQMPTTYELLETLADTSQDPPRQTEQNMMQVNVRNALLRLTADQRQVVMLKYLEGWSNEEIARSVGKGITAVKALQHRALTSLRRLLISERLGE